jgi:hypothetical protein
VVRITIEMTEAESRSTMISQEVGGSMATVSAAREAPAINGGSPPEPLLLALGAKSELAAAGTADGGDRDAGGPPSWLVDMITAGAGGRPSAGLENQMGRG